MPRRSFRCVSGTLAMATALACRPSPAPSDPVHRDELASTSAYLLYGHRGARGLRPENTLPAFELALDLEVDVLELDLVLSKDDALIVAHDPFVFAEKCRIDAAASPQPPVPTATNRVRMRELSREQIAGYRCDLNPDPQRFPEQRPVPGVVAGDRYGMPTLPAVFDFVAAYASDPRKTESQRANAARVRFDIETKRNPAEPSEIGDGFDGRSPGVFERRLVETVQEQGLIDRVIIQSYDIRSLRAVRTLEPQIATALLTEFELPVFTELVADGIEIWSPDEAQLDSNRVEAAHRAGLEVVPYTINDPRRMERALRLGVDGIITDRPDLAPPRR